MKAFTVQELRDQLDMMIADGNGEMEVMYSYNYGDHWHTQVCGAINSLDVMPVKYSAYHSMDKLDEEYDETAAEDLDQDGPDKTRLAIVLTKY